MKKVILIIIYLLFVPTIVNAGDIPEALMNGEQQALFIGKIVDDETEMITIKPLTIMMGSVPQEKVKVNKFEYYGTSDTPKTGDYLVVVLLEENKIDDSWIFKATSDNYKNLQLVSEKYNMVKRYQKYINEGAYFDAQKRLDKKNNGKYKTTEDEVSKNIVVQNNNIEKANSNINIKLYLVTGLLILIAITTYIIISKKKS